MFSARHFQNAESHRRPLRRKERKWKGKERKIHTRPSRARCTGSDMALVPVLCCLALRCVVLGCFMLLPWLTDATPLKAYAAGCWTYWSEPGQSWPLPSWNSTSILVPIHQRSSNGGVLLYSAKNTHGLMDVSFSQIGYGHCRCHKKTLPLKW